jgi:hypothetical protein
MAGSKKMRLACGILKLESSKTGVMVERIRLKSA